MAQRGDEQDSGLGVVYRNLDTHVPPARRRRSVGRRTGMVAAVLLTAALIAAPAIVYAGMLPETPPAGTVIPAAVEAPGSATPESATPESATPESATPEVEPPAGPIAIGELRSFALSGVPDGWTCPASDVTAVATPSVGAVWATTIVAGDVDNDGTEDAVAVLRCVLKESAGPEVAVVFTRRGADVVPLGVVTATTGTTVQWLSAVRVRTGGAITITAGDLQPYADQLAEWTRYQDAEFWYVGNGQFSGSSSSFTPMANPSSRTRTDLWVRSGTLTHDESGEGTISLTVGNRGPVVADDVWLSLDLGGPLAARDQGWSRCLEVRASPPWAVPAEPGRSATVPPSPVPPAGPAPVQCRLGDLGVDEEVKLLLVVHQDGVTAAAGSVVAYRRALGGAPVPDVNPADDQAPFEIR